MATKKRTQAVAASAPRTELQPATVAPDLPEASPQAQSILFRDAGDKVLLGFKVEEANLSPTSARLVGWSAGPCVLQVTCDGEDLECSIYRSKREDVAAALGIPETNSGFGFLISAPRRAGRYGLRVVAEVGGQTLGRTYPLELKGVTSAPKPPTVPEASGQIEGAAASSITGHAVVAGWVVHGPNAQVWLETEDGVPIGLGTALRIFRRDVMDVHGAAYGSAAVQSGFVIRLEDVSPGQVVRLVAREAGNAVVLAQATCSKLPSDPVAASRWLYGLNTPLGDLHRRIGVVDMPVITPLMDGQLSARAALPVTVRQLGTPLKNPAVSVIVPLYSRSDFVEHQLVEFCKDAWFKANAELIYVVDDPKLVLPFAEQAEALFRLYQLPFQWVWGGANRGFSGANNLGATRATAPNLLFLNSDVFPQGPGWLEQMLEVLATRERVGAVGARLVFANGAIQHAGMEFVRREELGVWVNHHPSMGLDPGFDPHHELTLVPAVTGACLAMRRAQFDAVGGWDTGYLIGDFEDSDLCLKLRSGGWDIAYLPTVQLTHLERQSFTQLGVGGFRTYVVVYNAMRHQARWAGVLDGISH